MNRLGRPCTGALQRRPPLLPAAEKGIRDNNQQRGQAKKGEQDKVNDDIHGTVPKVRLALSMQMQSKSAQEVQAEVDTQQSDQNRVIHRRSLGCNYREAVHRGAPS